MSGDFEPKRGWRAWARPRDEPGHDQEPIVFQLLGQARGRWLKVRPALRSAPGSSTHTLGRAIMALDRSISS